MNGNAWPSMTSQADFWGVDPASVPCRRSVPAPVRAGRRQTAPRIAEGVAVRFGVIFKPTHDLSDRRTRFFLLNGALDRSLRKIARGRASCPLVFEHSGPVITDDLLLCVRDGALHVETTDPAAIALLRSTSKRELSVGIIAKWAYVEEKPLPVAGIIEADLYEIAVVSCGSCRDCSISI